MPDLKDVTLAREHKQSLHDLLRQGLKGWMLLHPFHQWTSLSQGPHQTSHGHQKLCLHTILGTLAIPEQLR